MIDSLTQIKFMIGLAIYPNDFYPKFVNKKHREKCMKEQYVYLPSNKLKFEQKNSPRHHQA